MKLYRSVWGQCWGHFAKLLLYIRYKCLFSVWAASYLICRNMTVRINSEVISDHQDMDLFVIEENSSYPYKFH
jgi:hypothetical protein